MPVTTNIIWVSGPLATLWPMRSSVVSLVLLRLEGDWEWARPYGKRKELVTIKTTKYIALIDASEGYQTTSDKLDSMIAVDQPEYL